MSKERKINIVIIILIFSVAFIIKLYNDKKSNELLQGEKSSTFGYFERYTYFYGGGSVSTFNYFVDDKEYKLKISKNLDFMDIGDTILIRYSVTHPSVAEVEDLYYMEKYKHLRDSPNSVINSWTQNLVITLNLCHEFTSEKMEPKREGGNPSIC